MAQPDSPTVARERIEGILHWLELEWGERVPEYARAWEHWTEDEKLIFVSEATIREDRLQQARGWQMAGLLSSDDKKALACIEALIVKNRPLIQPLLDED